MGGENFDLTNNDAILEINSPKNSVNGPYCVVYKDLEERWAVVALDWTGEPCLGMRWFWENIGMPSSYQHPQWFIVPDELAKSLLNGFPLPHKDRHQIDKFLNGEITGQELKDFVHLHTSDTLK